MATVEYQPIMEMQNIKITPAARLGIFVSIALLGAILVLNAVQLGWFRRPRRHNWALLSYEKAREVGREVGRDDARRELASGSLAMEGRSGLPAEWTGEFIKILFAEYHIKV